MIGELPNLAYWFIGVLVVSNVGTIISVLVIGSRGIWWLSHLDSRVAAAESDIIEIKQDVRDLRPAFRGGK